MERDRPPFQVVMPSLLTKDTRPPPPKARPLSVQDAWRFTPLTTSPLQPIDNLSIPSLAAFNSNAALVSKAERGSATAFKYSPTIREGLQKLLNPGELAEM